MGSVHWLTYDPRLSSIQTNSTTTHVGIIDPIYNKGPLFWYRLDESIRTELEEQHVLSKEGDAPPFAGDVLLGIAQTITGQKPAYLDRMLRYLGDAARAGYSPARAIYMQIMEAHGQVPEFTHDILDEWMLQAVSEGYFFTAPGQHDKKVEEAKDRFRSNAGFCSDPFLGKKDVVAAITQNKVLEWRMKSGDVLDRKGNTVLHAAAALGSVDALHSLLSAQVGVDVANENGETPLYKAFQAGHAKLIDVLLDHGASASCSNQQKVTPLHWLFMVPKAAVDQVAKRMVEKGADVNAVMEPVVKENSGGFPEKIQILH
jgi:hypothetical protein